MKTIFWIASCLACALAPSVPGQPWMNAATAFETVTMPGAGSMQQGVAHVTRLALRRTVEGDGLAGLPPETDAGVEVGLVVFGRVLTLELDPIDVFAPAATVVRVSDRGRIETPAHAPTYRGVVSGWPDSVVAVTLLGGFPEGLIVVGDDLYLLSRSLGHAAQRAGSLQAWHGSASALGLTATSRRASRRGTGRATQLHLIEIAAVADFEYFQLHGANAASQIASVINQVDAVYKSEIETSIRILTTMVFETAADPFSDFNSGNLFNDFRNTTSEFGTWRAGQGGDLSAAGLGHLFSDKFGINAGFGFTNVLCDASRGASVTTTNFTSLHALLVEHEFGHNFGADHDGEAGSSCASAPPGFIMAPSATGTQFSDCSKAIMRASRDRAPCISLLPVQVCGDASGDGLLSATDALLALLTGVGAGNCPACTCDVNQVNGTNATDALLILQSSVGQQVALSCAAC